jgi:hypothetical protein
MARHCAIPPIRVLLFFFRNPEIMGGFSFDFYPEK